MDISKLNIKKGKSYKCISDFYMLNGELSFKKGKNYIVHKIDGNDIYFIDEDYEIHSMSNRNLDYFDFKNRKEKIKRLLKD